VEALRLPGMKQMGCNSKLVEQCPCHVVSVTLTSIRDFNSTTSNVLHNEVSLLRGTGPNL
jgi:hypothetical protein